MEEKINISNIEFVLMEYFAGKLSQAQQQEVEIWLNQSQGNRQIAKDIQYICSATDVMADMKQINSYSALTQVKKKISKQSGTSLVGWFLRIAAILIFPLMVSTLYFILKQEPVNYIEVRTNPGMVTVINLPDKSKVWLNSGSYLKYPQQFAGNSRDVELNGEAYFSIHKDKSKKFIVNTPFHLKAEVLGTEFNMNAYKANNNVTTTLVSGSVKLSFHNKRNEEESIIMKPDEEVEYNEKTKGIKTSKPFIPTQTAWKDGMVIFRNTPFEDALKIVSKRFNVEFIVKNEALYNSSFTGTFDGQHLNLILEHFRLSSNIQYRSVDSKAGKEKNIMEKTIVELY